MSDYINLEFNQNVFVAQVLLQCSITLYFNNQTIVSHCFAPN